MSVTSELLKRVNCLVNYPEQDGRNLWARRPWQKSFFLAKQYL